MPSCNCLVFWEFTLPKCITVELIADRARELNYFHKLDDPVKVDQKIIESYNNLYKYKKDICKSLHNNFIKTNNNCRNCYNKKVIKPILHILKNQVINSYYNKSNSSSSKLKKNITKDILITLFYTISITLSIYLLKYINLFLIFILTFIIIYFNRQFN